MPIGDRLYQTTMKKKADATPSKMKIVKFKMPARKKKGPSPSKYLKNTEPSPRYSSAKKL